MDQSIESKRLEEILGAFRGRKFFVLGDVMLDRYVYGTVSRISPEAPVPVVRVEREESRLGGAANVANNLSSIGAEVRLCGIIGADADKEALSAQLAERKIEAGFLVIDPDRPTTRKTRIIAHQQQVVRVDHESDRPVGNETAARLAKIAKETIPGVDGVVLSDYGKGIVTEELIRTVVMSSVGGQFVAVDPKVKHFSNYRGVSLVTPNLSEAGLAAGEKIVDEASLLRAGQRLLEMLPGTAVLLTRGEQGMTLFDTDRSVTHIPTVARHVYDVTGAGDTVISTLPSR